VNQVYFKQKDVMARGTSSGTESGNLKLSVSFAMMVSNSLLCLEFSAIFLYLTNSSSVKDIKGMLVDVMEFFSALQFCDLSPVY
jgi:hypothetical protein